MTSNTGGKKLVGHPLNPNFRAGGWFKKDLEFFPVIYFDGNAQRFISTMFRNPIKTGGISTANHYQRVVLPAMRLDAPLLTELSSSEESTHDVDRFTNAISTANGSEVSLT